VTPKGNFTIFFVTVDKIVNDRKAPEVLCWHIGYIEHTIVCKHVRCASQYSSKHSGSQQSPGVNSTLYSPVALLKDGVAGNHWRAEREGSTEGLYMAIENIKMYFSSGYEIRHKHSKLGPFHGATAPSGQGPLHYRGFTITLRHTTFGRTSLEEWSARRRDLYLTTHNTHKTQTSMPLAGLEPTIPASERPRGRCDWHRPFLATHFASF
jgi:hypothetical protein